MLPPHWLDDAFKTPKRFLEDLVAHSNFKKAIQKAEEAYRETTEDIEANPDLCGPTPEQAARVAFVNAITEQDSK